jgi:hypothetical protein
LIKTDGRITESFSAYRDFLDSNKLRYTIVETASVCVLDNYDIVMVPDWKEQHQCYYALKVYYYRGGRLLAGPWDGGFWAKALSSWIWDIDAEQSLENILQSEDHRAVYLSDLRLLSDSEKMNSVFAKIRSSEVKLTNEPDFKTYETRKSRWEINGESLYIDDKPALLRGVGTLNISGRLSLDDVEKNIAMYRDMNLNFIVAYSSYDADLDHFEDCLDLIQEYGLKAFVWIQGPKGHALRGVAIYGEKPLKDEWWLRHLRYKNHPALIGWNMCDDTYDRYYPFMERTHRIIKQYDQTNMVTTTMMDTRKPDTFPKESVEKWKSLVDFPITYLYPLQRDGIFAPKMIEGGLEDLQRLISNTQKLWEQPVYIQIWCQAHLQGFAYERLGGIEAEDVFVPTPEQQRLMTWYILMAGGRGIVYFHNKSVTDEWLGMGRRNEIGLMFYEFQPFEKIIAGGERISLSTSQPDVEATGYLYNGEAAILVAKHIPQSQRYVDDGSVRRVQLRIPENLPHGMRYYQVKYPDVVEIPLQKDLKGSNLLLADFDLTTIIFGTANNTNADEATSYYSQHLQRLSQMALDILIDKKAKTEIIMENLPETFQIQSQQSFAHGQHLFDKAVNSFKKKDFAEAYSLSRKAIVVYRNIQASVVKATDNAMQKMTLSIEQKRMANIYFSLPYFYSSLEQVPAVKPGQLREHIQNRIAAYKKLLVNETAVGIRAVPKNFL